MIKSLRSIAVLASLVTSNAYAHPGHELTSFDANSGAHYWFEPVHAFEWICVAILGALGWVAFQAFYRQRIAFSNRRKRS